MIETKEISSNNQNPKTKIKRHNKNTLNETIFTDNSWQNLYLQYYIKSFNFKAMRYIHTFHYKVYYHVRTLVM